METYPHSPSLAQNLCIINTFSTIVILAEKRLQKLFEILINEAVFLRLCDKISIHILPEMIFSEKQKNIPEPFTVKDLKFLPPEESGKNRKFECGYLS